MSSSSKNTKLGLWLTFFAAIIAAFFQFVLPLLLDKEEAPPEVPTSITKPAPKEHGVPPATAEDETAVEQDENDNTNSSKGKRQSPIEADVEPGPKFNVDIKGDNNGTTIQAESVKVETINNGGS